MKYHVRQRVKKFLKGKKRKLLLRGDCTKLMRKIPENSVDAIVTDPPYGLAFMGKKWDSFGWSQSHLSKPGIGERSTSWVSHGDKYGGSNPTCASCGGRKRGKKKCECEKPDWRVKGKPLVEGSAMRGFYLFSLAWAKQALRVAKPGSYLLAFGGTRAYHQMATAIEDAGWETRDCILNLISGDAKFKRLWENLDTSQQEALAEVLNDLGMGGILAWVYGSGFPKSLNVSKQLKDSDDAKEWEGWGTALKPAFEPIIVARKPLNGTVASNVIKYGTGAMNIDECRVMSGPRPKREAIGEATQGRWPANIIHDGSEDVESGFPQAPGALASVSDKEPSDKTANTFGKFASRKALGKRGGSGSASRFFYCPKVSKSERNAGCDSLPQKSAGDVTGGRKEGSAGLKSPRAGAGRGSGNKNEHPTVKPVALMRYLIKLVTRRRGVVLDPFMGSGSTGVAAMSSTKKRWRFIGIEKSKKYMKIAKARISHSLSLSLGTETMKTKKKIKSKKGSPGGLTPLFG